MKINIQKLFAAFKIQRSIIRLFFACLFAVVPQWLFAQLPSDIPSLKLWLRPDTYITLNPDTTINTWKNIIDTNLVFTSPPSVPAILPPHVQNNPAELNNHDVAHFDITRPDGLKSQLPLSLNNNRITVLIFIRYRNSAIGIGHLICYGLGQAGIDSWNLRECSSSGRMSFIWRDTGEGAGAIGSNCFGNTSNLTLTPNFTFVSGFEDPTIPSGGNWFIAENFVHKDSIQLNYIPGDTNTVTLGYREDLAIAGLPYYADFDVAEIMIFDSTLTSSQLADLRSYLQIRYSQLVNLGPDYTTSDLCADTLDAGSYFSSFLWSTGDTTQTIVVNSAGTYYVETTDMYGFLSYDTIVISYPTPALPSTNIICAGDSLPWNTNLGSAYSYLWSTSETTSSIYIDTAGTYTVTVTDSLGCSTSASIIAVMDSFPLTASIGPDSVSLCAGNSIALVSGAAQAQTYSWTPQTPGDDSLSTHVVDTTSGWYYLDVTDTNGCRARDSIYVTIIGVAPSVNFLSPPVCEGDTMFFTDVSTPDTSIAARNWNFGEPSSGANNISSLQNPYHIYADSGAYQVTLVDTTNVGCYNDTTITVRVYPKPAPDFFTLSSCEDSPTLFINTSNTFNYSVQSYAWNFGDPGSGGNNFSSDTNGIHTYSLPGVYIVTLTVINIHGCSATVTIPDTVNPSAAPQFQPLTNCYGEPMEFINLTTGSYQYIYWDFGDNSGSPSPGPPVFHLYAYADTFMVTLSTTTSLQCVSETSMQVIVNPLPNAYFLTTSACENSLYTFDDSSWISSGAVTAWQWTFPNSSTSTVQNPMYVFTDSLIYPVTLVAISQSNCKDTITDSIKVYPQPVADFGFSYSYGDAPLTESFGNLSSGAVSYLWDFGDTTPTSNDTNPVHTYYNRGTFTVTLIATSIHGCMDTTIKYIYVIGPILDIGVNSVYISNGTNYISVTANLGNFGNLEILNYKISATLENRLPVFENVTSNLMPGDDTNYTFNANFEISSSNPPQYICVEATNPNNETDDNPANNLLCINLSEDFVIVDPFPNPSTDLINLLIIAPHKERLAIDVFDAGGKLVSNVFDGIVTTGLNKFTFDTSMLSEGVYFCRYSFLTKTFVRPLTHIAKNK